jgi:ribonuclease HII
MIVGVDEAGRGPLAGPVLSCALCLKKRLPFAVKDSKAMSAPIREKVFCWLIDNSFFHLGLADHREIDRLNILEATFLSFNRAIEGLLIKHPQLCSKAKFIIDGNLFKTDLKLNYACIKGADKRIPEVSCASVVAKVARDHLMTVADFLYPKWNFSQNKGYPTKEHMAFVKKSSLSPIHRRSFYPCRRK